MKAQKTLGKRESPIFGMKSPNTFIFLPNCQEE